MRILLLLACLIISGCESIRIKGEVQEVQVPLLYCPAPAAFNRPELQINNLTKAESASDGKVAQAYVATVLQLLGYVDELEQSLEFYKNANVSYDQLQDRLFREITKDGAEQESGLNTDR